jgi:hypothetical protein
MTTKVSISCPDNSHWAVKVEVQDKIMVAQVIGGVATINAVPSWSTTEIFELKPTESRETYVHSTRRLVIEEVPTQA